MADNDPPQDDPTDAKPPIRLVPVDGAGDRSESAADDASPAANDEALLIRIAHLEEDHRDLSLAIEALEAQTHHDRLTVARLKKKKLRLKDEIQKLKNSFTPDIIA